ncbi:hypothetical protein PoB_005839900 [Plakobranchus ocellatus]|uniref:Uncharacterized protein n=1 Tax=Plakobranchus ocellatus TaxID=259542 RepID=A0AAV4CGK5_9GAST|nr:hypothetical protein PoB_005839900 [Plakobranchus ocellatus]
MSLICLLCSFRLFSDQLCLNKYVKALLFGAHKPSRRLKSLAETRTLDTVLKAWDHVVAGGQFEPTNSTSSLGVNVDYRKYPLTSTSCHLQALAKELTAYDFSSLATLVPRW